MTAVMDGERRIKLKQPYVERGKRWQTFAVRKLYLEDVEYIYRVMYEYASYSPSFQRSKALHEKSKAWRERMVEAQREILKMRAQLGVNDTAEPLSPVEPLDPPVSIEVDDTYIVHSVEDLRYLNLSGIKNLTIKVGGSDLRLHCSNFGIRLSTWQDDDQTTMAFDQIKRCVKQREIPVLRLVHTTRFLSGWLMAYIAIVVTGFFVESPILSVFALSFTAIALLFAIYIFGFAFRTRTVFVPGYSRNASKPWYSGTEMKVAMVVTILGGIITWWLNRD